MKPFAASFDTVVTRYYLMMAVVIVSFYAGVPALAFLALPIFLLAFMGVSFKAEPKEIKTKKTSKEANMVEKSIMSSAA